MKLFIYSTQKELNTILQDHFSAKGHLCVVFDGLEHFFGSIEKTNNPPDLMILDYLIYNHDIFNLFNYLESQNCIYPCIFYNDPCVTRSNRVAHWKAQLNVLQNKTMNLDVEKLDPILNDLRAIIENKQLAPSIYLMQQPVPFPKEFVAPKITLDYIQENENDGIEDFRKRNNLPNNLYYLLKLLHNHQDKKLTISEIRRYYEKDNKEIEESSLYVMLSKLRSIVRDDKQARFIIRKDGDYYYFIKFISKPESE
ncbi:MAG: hypothetical protein K5681_00950 [Treponema sp.]|nr:hypothetical protein [Treponema sp.]